MVSVRYIAAKSPKQEINGLNDYLGVIRATKIRLVKDGTVKCRDHAGDHGARIPIDHGHSHRADDLMGFTPTDDTAAHIAKADV